MPSMQRALALGCQSRINATASNSAQKEFRKDFQSDQEWIPKKESVKPKNHKGWSLDSLTPEKIREMQELLEMLEKLKSWD